MSVCTQNVWNRTIKKTVLCQMYSKLHCDDTCKKLCFPSHLHFFPSNFHVLKLTNFDPTNSQWQLWHPNSWSLNIKFSKFWLICVIWLSMATIYQNFQLREKKNRLNAEPNGLRKKNKPFQFFQFLLFCLIVFTEAFLRVALKNNS